jgi:hypothetical protein
VRIGGREKEKAAISFGSPEPASRNEKHPASGVKNRKRGDGKIFQWLEAT